MHKRLIIFLLITLFAIYHWANVPSFPQDVECVQENQTFKGGEELVYKAYYNWGFLWLSAGEATFRVVESEDYYEIFVEGKSYPSYDGFFKLRDKFYSKLSKKTLLPEIFERTVNEGEYKKYERTEFNQKNKFATTWVGETKSEAKESSYEFESCMHDLLSLMYSMRNIDVDNYNVGDYLPKHIFFDKEVFPIKVRYGGKESKKKIKGLGKFQTLKVTPDLIAGHIFNDDDQMQVWITDDDNKLPLMIESPLKIGSLKAVLISYKGLRHEMTAKK